jgi:rhodanese-related sulfurtransferase
MSVFHSIRLGGLTCFLFFVIVAAEISVNAASLSYEVVADGNGKVARQGLQVSVHYQGRLTDGTVFDDSRKRGEPLTFTLGSGQVIPGWEQGVDGMKVGEKRLLTIPPELGYGAAGAGSLIPSYATLIFDVELIAVSIQPKLANAKPADLIAAQDKGVAIIDIRRPKEWASTGIIAGSHTITAFNKSGQLHPDFQSKFTAIALAPDTPVVLYCRTGNRTSIIGNALVQKLGYRNITHLTKGIVGWAADGEFLVPYNP